jgi:mono/diheme cytochrome c family protein
MEKRTVFLYLIFSLLLYNCTQSNKENNREKDEINQISKQDLAEGFHLIENNCFSCHSPNASLENRIAPPMEAIKKHYINKNTSQAEFTADLINFMKNPTEEKSKMPGAVDRFNLMPKMNFSEDQLTKIAAYIYLSELEKPDWFEKHYQEERLKNNLIYHTDTTPIKVGQNIALQTKSVLGKNLLGAINAGGTENAISFCSTKAIPLTDSMAVALNANIKRVSDKNRNPNNKANESELAYIEEIKLAISQGEAPKPSLTTTEDKHIAYYPIMTDKMCMQCHGQKETEILPSTLNKIGEIYPNDLATGYKIGELRGIWVVEMDKN